METFRTFIALRTSPELLTTLGALQQRLQQRLAPGAVRWTRRDQLHLTLAFLGNVASSRLEALAAALRGACAGIPPIRLTLAGIGGFPNGRRPRIVWVGMEGEMVRLGDLQQRIEVATKGFGDHPAQHAFQPHLTIGRVNTRDPRAPAAVGAALDETQVGLLGGWTAAQVQLVRSQLSAAGATYTDLAAIALAAGD